MVPAWLAGVAINLVGSIMINLGTNVMKMGHNKLALLTAAISSSSTARPPIYAIREWQVGVSLFSLGNVANFVSFGYAAQSLLAAIGCVQFVSNVVFAALVLKEKVSRGVLAATALIVAGCVLLVSGGSHASEKFTYKELLRLYGQPAYVAYMCLTGATVVAAYAAYWLGQRAVTRAGGARHAALWSAALPVLYSVFSALIGTQSVLMSKTLAVLLRSTLTGDNQLGKWFTWLVLFAFLTTAIFWVTRLNKGLRMFPALVIVPALQICWTLFSILSGMLYFQEYATMQPLPTALFVLGVGVVFAGVFLLTRASQPHQAADAGRAASPGRSPLAVKAPHGTAVAGARQRPGEDGEWELQAVRGPQQQAAAGRGPDTDSAVLGLRLAAQLSAQQQQHQQGGRRCTYSGGGNDDDEPSSEPDEEEEYERALLSATSFTSSFQLHRQRAAQQQLPPQQGAGVAVAAAAGDGGAEGSPAAAGGGQAGDAAGDGTEQEPAAAARGSGRGAKARHNTQQWLDKVRLLKRRVAADFDLDEASSARLALGLGDAHTPGFSLFAVPVVDLAAASEGAGGYGGRRSPYGRVPEASSGGMAHTPQAGGLCGAPASADGTHCISHAGGAGQAGMGRSDNQSFLHPPAQSNPPSEAEMGGMLGVTQQRGPVHGINPLGNAIDIRTCAQWSARATPAALTPQGSGIPTLPPPSPRAQAAWRTLKANLQDLKAGLQQAGGGGGGGGRSYERMTSRDEVAAAAVAAPAAEGQPGSGAAEGC